MAKSKRISIKDPEIVRILLQKQLDIHGVSYDYIAGLPDGKLPNGESWFQHYTFETEEQWNEWRDFCITTLRNTRERLPKYRAEKEFRWIDLMWGLKQSYNHNNEISK